MYRNKGIQNGNEGRMLDIDHDMKDELFHKISCNSETHRLLDIEKIRSRLDLMKDRSPNTRYICNDVRLKELNDTVPRKGVLREGTRRSKKMTVYKYYLFAFLLAGVYIGTKFKNYKLHLRKLE